MRPGARRPTVAAVRPNNGPTAGGTSVAIAGSGFAAGSKVTFGQASATSVTINSSTSITAASPSEAAPSTVTVTSSSGTSAAVPRDQFAYDSPPSGPWLGLNGNSSTYLGPVDRFVEHGIVYDRSGAIEWTAGELPEEGGRATEGGEALGADIRDGMVPVVTIEYRRRRGEFRSDPSFPTEAEGSSTLREYVEGFVRSATAILAAYPGKTILFEPINEPWGSTTPQYDGAEYADVIAKLLPAARQARHSAEQRLRRRLRQALGRADVRGSAEPPDRSSGLVLPPLRLRQRQQRRRQRRHRIVYPTCRPK